VYIGSINDEGYTQAHDKGRIAVEALGVKTAYIENVAENAMPMAKASTNSFFIISSS
jgi:basic membrane protein A